MKFTRKSDYHSESQEGYVISAMGTGQGWRFMAYKNKQSSYSTAEDFIGAYDESADAVAGCDKHWRESIDAAA